MIRRGRRYIRKVVPHTEVTVIRRSGGQVTYVMHHRKPTEVTLSVASFKDIYQKVRKCRK